MIVPHKFVAPELEVVKHLLPSPPAQALVVVGQRNEGDCANAGNRCHVRSAGVPLVRRNLRNLKVLSRGLKSNPLFCNILAVSPLDARFYLATRGALSCKSFEFNILSMIDREKIMVGSRNKAFANSLLRRILPTNYLFSRFCRDQRRAFPTKSFRNNILQRWSEKICGPSPVAYDSAQLDCVPAGIGVAN